MHKSVLKSRLCCTGNFHLDYMSRVLCPNHKCLGYTLCLSTDILGSAWNILFLLSKLLHLFQGPLQKLFPIELSSPYKSELITSSFGPSQHFEPLNGNYFILSCAIYMFKYICLIRP